MDVNDLIPSETSTYYLHDPKTGERAKDDNGKIMFITVYGQHSRPYRKAWYDVRRSVIADGNMDYEAAEKESARLIAAITQDWNIQFKGENLKLTKANAERFYMEAPGLRDRVEDHARNDANFLPDSSAASNSSRKQNSG